MMESFVTSRALEVEIKEFCKRSHLTPRESDILKILVEGTVRIKDVAARLSLSPNTINNHVNSIFTKTRTTSKSQLLAGFLNSVAEELQRARFMRQTPQVLLLASQPERFKGVAETLRSNGFFVCFETKTEDFLTQASSDLWRFILIDLECVPTPTDVFIGELQQKAGVFASVILMGKREDVRNRVHAMHMGAMDLFDVPVDEEQLLLNLMSRYIENEQDRARFLMSRSQAFRSVEEKLQVAVDQIGVGGVALSSNDLDRCAKSPVQPGEFVTLKLRVVLNQESNDQREEELRAHGQVVWRGEGERAQTGVRFVHLPQEGRALVARCTQSHSAVGMRRSFIPCQEFFS